MIPKILAAVFVVFVAVALSFQNCSQHSFTPTAGPSQSPGDNNKFEIRDFQLNTDPHPKIDILFVMDDSCSMQRVIDKVSAGISSLKDVAYPNDTLMAFTYMSPARMNADGTIDFNTPYTGVKRAHVHASPGHLKLVTKTSIAEYLDFRGGASEDFQFVGCNVKRADDNLVGWFAPLELDVNGRLCLLGAAQAPYFCTGIESGLTSYWQLLKLFSVNNQRLFRKGAKVHLIMISDTHDPGIGSRQEPNPDGYYGADFAPAKRFTTEEIKDSTFVNSPEISSFTISGIVPLPMGDHPVLRGVQVIGALPKNQDEIYVSEEALNNYAYLPYIKDTGGVAVHVGEDQDWQGAMERLIEVIQATHQIVLGRQIKEIVYLKINDQECAASEYRLQGDNKTVTILKQLVPDTVYSIQIRYRF